MESGRSMMWAPSSSKSSAHSLRVLCRLVPACESPRSLARRAAADPAACMDSRRGPRERTTRHVRRRCRQSSGRRRGCSQSSRTFHRRQARTLGATNSRGFSSRDFNAGHKGSSLNCMFRRDSGEDTATRWSTPCEAVVKMWWSWSSANLSMSSVGCCC